MSALRSTLAADLLRAEAHLLHCETVLAALRAARAEGGFERALLNRGVSQLEADDIARCHLVPSVSHARTRRAIARLKKRIARLERWTSYADTIAASQAVAS